MKDIALNIETVEALMFAYTPEKLLDIGVKNDWVAVAYLGMILGAKGTSFHLEQAVKHENTRLVDMLLDSGVKHDARHYNLIHFAIMHNRPGVIKTLLDYDINPRGRTSAKETALDIAIRLEDTETVELLLDLDACNERKARDYLEALEIDAEEE